MTSSETTGGPSVVIRHVPRTLGLGALVFIMFFTVSGGAYGLEDTIGESGPGMGLLLILLAPLIWAIPSALVVAELATAMPVEGGYYYWVKKALGPFWGFQEGWWSWVTSWVDMAIYPVLFVEYTAYFFPEQFGEEGSTLNRWLLGAGLIWVFTYLNIRGSKVIGDSSKLFGVIVIAPFVLVTIFALFKWQFNPFQPFVNPGQGITSAFGLGLFVVMWNYLGWDGVSTIAGEMKNPQRDYPKMLLITVPLITAVYFIPTITSLAAVGAEDIEWTAGAYTVIAEAVSGPWLGFFLAVAAMVAAAGLFSSLLLSISRVPFVMGEDGYLPRALLKTHPRYGTPWVALIVSSLIYTVFILGPFQSLVVVDVTIYAAALLLEFAALVALRIKAPDMPRPFKIPGGWLGVSLVVILPTAVIGLAVFYQAYFEGWQGSIGLALVGLATGPLLYPIMKARRRKLGMTEPVSELDASMTSERPRDWEEPVKLPSADTGFDSILVPFDGSHAAELALGYAAALAAYSGGEIVVVVAYDPPITVRRRGSLSLDSIRSEMEEEAHGLATESVTLLTGKGVQARGIVVRGEVIDAILDTVSEEKSDIIIMGKRGLSAEMRAHGGRPELGHGSVADKVIKYSVVPVLVVG